MIQTGQQDLLRAADDLAARLPARLAVFARLAYNYRWSWMPGGPDVFREVDPYRWSMRRENPIRLLLDSPDDALIEAAKDRSLVARAEAMEQTLKAELADPVATGSNARPIVFLCAEYGIHRSLPTYAGGLGVLAGDVLKEASDRRLPLVGVGILYRQGYFHQRVDTSGWQHEYWIESDPDRLPAALVTGPDGQPLTVMVNLWGRGVRLQIWRVDVGRVPLFLLDAQRSDNDRMDRWITARLYIGDRKIRLAQYALLGIGGIRALRAMGIDPAVVHLNEGHAALAPVELAREAMVDGRSLEDALQDARGRTVFTTHTPIPAGNESYVPEEVSSVLGGYPMELGLSEGEFFDLGRPRPEPDEQFGVTVLGIRMSRQVNGVSRRHGEVTRALWHGLFPEQPVEAVPIGHVTNGVHVPTWMAPPMRALLDQHLAPGWIERASDPATWEPVEDIPDEELWGVRSALRAELVDYVRDRSVGDRLAREEPADYAEAAARAFDPSILTVGFARRVAAYKRLPLLIHDPGRMLQLVGGDHPMQVVLAGKAHPQDEEAKRVLQAVFSLKLDPHVAERIAFLEDYDMGMAARLVWGCDVWVNVPRPPLEASGTSGMKSALNGGLNLSVMDGWWEEAFDGQNGWAIPGDPSLDVATQDLQDAAALYDLLEDEVCHDFYRRDERGIPRAWVRRMKASLRTIGPRYSATRMLDEYLGRVYELT
ncbi:MAG: glycosyltransferase family 1 protein [Actinobacteria bacterium]|nr:MAG: glycosyltransferase family 1 protein [Actinomycetota bacterium]